VTAHRAVVTRILVMGLAISASHTVAGTIVVDSFDTPPVAQAVSISDVKTFDDTEGYAGAALGTYRKLGLKWTTPQNQDIDAAPSGSVTVGANAGLTIEISSGMPSETTIFWNVGGWGLNYDPDWGIDDITDGGSNVQLQVIFDELVGSMVLRFDLYSGDTFQSRPTIFECEEGAVPGEGPVPEEHACVQATIPDGYVGGSIEFLFDDFIVGSSFEPTNLFSIAMIVTSTDDDFRTVIRSVKAVGPQSVPVPATLPIVMLGLMGMAFAGRRSRRS